jgi:hypothetical protein
MDHPPYALIDVQNQHIGNLVPLSIIDELWIVDCGLAGA